MADPMILLVLAALALAGNQSEEKPKANDPQNPEQYDGIPSNSSRGKVFSTEDAFSQQILMEAAEYNQTFDNVQASLQQSKLLLEENIRLEQQSDEVCSKIRTEFQTCEREALKLVSFFNASILACRKDKDKQLIQQLSYELEINVDKLETCQSNLTDAQSELVIAESNLRRFKDETVNKTVWEYAAKLRWQQLYWVLLSFLEEDSPAHSQLDALGWNWERSPETPLYSAVDDSSTDLLEFLLDHGLSTETVVKTNSHFTLLHAAASLGVYDVAVVLLDRGADVDARSSEGYTPLMLAASNGHLELAELLVQRGAIVHAVDYSGSTAWSLASYNNKQDLVEYLGNIV